MLSVSENKQEERPGETEETVETEEMKEETEESDERRGVKRKISLTRCDVCEAEEAKYRCPNCLKFSCSLPCVKQHKHESGCSGVRDQTAFVRLSQFSEINLLNDYRFLEETARVADKPNRDTLARAHPHYSFTVKLVRKNAAAANVNLKILPKSFTRRKENTSIYIKAEKKLYWHLRLHFPQSDAQYTDRVPEDRLLERILSDYIHPTESDPVRRQRLKLYVLSPLDRLSVFMKSEARQPGSPRYHELDVKKSLRENLMFKTVVEYPELYVVLKEHCEEYLARFPERKRVVTSEPKGSSSTQEASHPRDNPEPPADPQHTGKKRKCVAADSELEEGEIMSEEDEEDEDEQHVSVGHPEGEKCAGADRLPHKDEGSSDDDDDRQCGTAENQKAPMGADPSPRPPGQDQENNDEGTKNGADAVHDQLVTMETTTPSVHGPCEDSDTERADGGTTDEKVATARDVHCGEAGDEGEVGGTGNGADVADGQKITMETDNPHPHGHEQVAPAVND